MLLVLLGRDSWMMCGQRAPPPRRRARESSARRSRDVRTVGAETEMAAITVPPHAAHRGGGRARGRPRAPPTSSRSRRAGRPRARRRRSAMVVIVLGPEPREPAERRLGGAEGHEDLAHRRRVDRDAAPDPVAGAERVRAVDLGEPGDAGRVSGWRRSSSRPSPGPSSLEERPRERGEVADARVAARVLDEHRPRPEAAARGASGPARCARARAGAGRRSTSAAACPP